MPPTSASGEANSSYRHFLISARNLSATASLVCRIISSNKGKEDGTGGSINNDALPCLQPQHQERPAALVDIFWRLLGTYPPHPPWCAELYSSNRGEREGRGRGITSEWRGYKGTWERGITSVLPCLQPQHQARPAAPADIFWRLPGTYQLHPPWCAELYSRGGGGEGTWWGLGYN